MHDSTHPVLVDRSWSTVVDAPVEEVHRRLNGALLPVGSLWFPTLAELRKWDASTATLFVCWQGERGFEIGPRLTNPQAARFSPVLRGTLVGEGHRTRVQATLVPPRFATGLLVVWAALLALWLILGLRAFVVEEEPLGWLVFWGTMVAALILAGGLGWTRGGRVLEERLGDLSAVLSDASAGEDDWA